MAKENGIANIFSERKCINFTQTMDFTDFGNSQLQPYQFVIYMLSVFYLFIRQYHTIDRVRMTIRIILFRRWFHWSARLRHTKVNAFFFSPHSMNAHSRSPISRI